LEVTPLNGVVTIHNTHYHPNCIHVQEQDIIYSEQNILAFPFLKEFTIPSKQETHGNLTEETVRRIVKEELEKTQYS